ncbi:MAG: HD domain-containing protein [Thermoplasmata archaeon]|nr:MAG: HD domain-containing protein [Thermoplasmata archaeon]
MKELPNSYYEIWEEFIEGKSEEAKLMQQIDKFEMLLQAYEYAAIYGKEKLEEFFEEEKNIEHPFLVSLIKEMKNIL